MAVCPGTSHDAPGELCGLRIATTIWSPISQKLRVCYYEAVAFLLFFGFTSEATKDLSQTPRLSPFARFEMALEGSSTLSEQPVQNKRCTLSGWPS